MYARVVYMVTGTYIYLDDINYVSYVYCWIFIYKLSFCFFQDNPIIINDEYNTAILYLCIYVAYSLLEG